MDSLVSSFKGFFALQEGEEDVQEQQQQHSADEDVTAIEQQQEAPLPSPPNASSTDDDLEIGKAKSYTQRVDNTSTIDKINNAFQYKRRDRSWLSDIFWSKTDDSKSVKAQFIASSSSVSSDARDVTDTTTSRSYHSDTSSTESSSGDDSTKQHRRGRSPRRRRRDIMQTADAQQPHLQCMSHGKCWTTVAIIATWLGFVLAHQAWTSTAFVALQEPLYVDPVWQEVSTVGMIRLELCYNETHLEEIGTVNNETGCTVHPLTSDEIDDRMFQTARSMAFLAVLLGGFVSVMMTTSLCWHSINLRPIGFGYLVAYFLQSFTFLFFDADLCTEHKCSLAQGGRFSAVASLCWIISCIAAARMDSHKFHKNLEWIREIRGRSRSRSASPQKRQRSPVKRKQLVRRTTSGTDPLSDGSISDNNSPRGNEDVEMTIGSGKQSRDSSGRSSSTRTEGGRRFAWNGCEIIQGIQDLEAAQAWAAKSPVATTPRSKSSKSSSSKSSKSRSRSKRPNLTIDVDDANASRHSSQLSSAALSEYSIGSPIQPSSTRQQRFAIRPMPSPSKRLDHSGDIKRSVSPTKRRTSLGSPSSMSTADDIISAPSSSSQSTNTRKKNTILKELEELDTLVNRSSARTRSSLWNHPNSAKSSPGISPASDAGVFFPEELEPVTPKASRHSSRGRSARPHTTTATTGSSRHSSRISTRSSTPASSDVNSSRSHSTTTEEHRVRRSVVFNFLEEDGSDDGYDLKERRSRRSSRARK